MVLLLLLILAAFPWGMFRGLVERKLAERIGAPVTIEAMTRLDAVSLTPRIRLRKVTIEQPRWAGRGALARIESAEVRVAVLPLLIGRTHISGVVLNRAQLILVRDASGRGNWETGSTGGGGDAPEAVTIRDSRLRLTDQRRHMQFDAALSADATGLRLDGTGLHRNQPMRITLRTGQATAGQPLRVEISSPLLRFAAAGRLDRPFSLHRFSASVRTNGRDLALLDDVIEAGLPATQDFVLTAQVRRDGRTWRIAPLAGTIGRSTRMTARLDITVPGDRTRLDGTVEAAQIDFDDFASDTSLAAGRARRARLGPRIVPYTRIDISKLGSFDGRVRLRSPRLIVNGAPMFRTIDVTADLDRRRLVLAPIAVGLAPGHITGRVEVDHRGRDPRLSLDLRLVGGTLEELFGSDLMRAPVQGHVQLAGGHGRDFRTAVARSTGSIALVAGAGDVRKRIAAMAGGDILDDSDKAERTTLRCLVLRANAMPGRLSTGALLVDTGVSRIDGTGGVSLPSEMVALVLTGQSKQPDFIRATPSVRLTGTLTNPNLRFPAVQRQHGFFGKIGAALKVLRIGKQREAAPDADCVGLTARALG